MMFQDKLWKICNIYYAVLINKRRLFRNTCDILKSLQEMLTQLIIIA